MRRWFRDESGAVVVEAAFVYPIVLLVLIFLLFWGLLQVQRATIFREVNTVADMGANTVSNESYSKLTKSGGSKDSIKEYYRTNNPYRYWNHDYGNSEGTLTEELIKRLNNATMISSGTFMNYDVEIQSEVLVQTVEVKADFVYQMPRIFWLIGMDKEIRISNSVVYDAIDPTEFVRNTDMVFDIMETLSKRFGIDEKIENFVTKLKNLKSKFG